MPDLMEGWSQSRRIAQPFVSGAAVREDVFERWYEQAREAGISYRRTDMLEDWRREKGLVLHQAQLERLRPGAQPPASWMTDKPWDGLTTSLVYEFRFTGRDAETQEGFDRFVGVGTNTRLTIEEAVNQFMGEYVDTKVYGDLEGLRFTVSSVWHKSESEYLD